MWVLNTELNETADGSCWGARSNALALIVGRLWASRRALSAHRSAGRGAVHSGRSVADACGECLYTRDSYRSLYTRSHYFTRRVLVTQGSGLSRLQRATQGSLVCGVGDAKTPQNLPDLDLASSTLTTHHQA